MFALSSRLPTPSPFIPIHPHLIPTDPQGIPMYPQKMNGYSVFKDLLANLSRLAGIAIC